MVEPKSWRSASSFLILITVATPSRSVLCFVTNLKSLMVTSTTCSDCDQSGRSAPLHKAQVTPNTVAHPHIRPLCVIIVSCLLDCRLLWSSRLHRQRHRQHRTTRR